MTIPVFVVFTKHTRYSSYRQFIQTVAQSHEAEKVKGSKKASKK